MCLQGAVAGLGIGGQSRVDGSLSPIIGVACRASARGTSNPQKSLYGLLAKNRMMGSQIDVLQYLAMHGIAETDELAEGTDAADVKATLETLQNGGWVEEDGFWYLSPSGEEYLDELCRDRFTAAEIESIESMLDEFEALDSRFKALSEEWQTATDPAGPDHLVDELGSLHDELMTLFSELDGNPAAVYEAYLDDLADAFGRLEAGETEYFTGTEIPSYHNVWFELHDDLLRTLSREREE
jgi:hypothetical protein